MNKKYFAFAVLMLGSLQLSAQETYENANIATEDLNSGEVNPSAMY